LKLIRPVQNSIFDISDNEAIKLLTRLRLGLSHLKKHKLLHDFADTVNLICSCNIEEESLNHYLLHCPNFDQIRIHLMNELNKVNPILINLDDISLCKILLYGDGSFDNETNAKIINLTIDFIHKSERFNIPLL